MAVFYGRDLFQVVQIVSFLDIFFHVDLFYNLTYTLYIFSQTKKYVYQPFDIYAKYVRFCPFLSKIILLLFLFFVNFVFLAQFLFQNSGQFKIQIIASKINIQILNINFWPSLMENQTANQPNKNHQEDQVEKRFYARLHQFYDQCFLTGLQKAAITKFIKVNFAKNDSSFDRIKNYLMAKINKQHIFPPTEGQKGCPDIIPGLRAKPWWNAEEFPWMKNFEQNYQKIRDEVLSLRNQTGFQPYRGPSWISSVKAKDGVGYESIDSGMWNVFYLELHNMKFDYNCQKIPFTMSLINQFIPNNYHHAFFSALTTKSHIMKHYGPTNKKLRFHLPLMGVQNSRLRVDKQIREQIAGKAYVFDDSFEHEAWHDGQQTRLILIVDFWHPDLTQNELKFLKVIQNAKFKAEHAISELDEKGDNFYSIIENAKDLIKQNDWWVIGSQSSPQEKLPQEHQE